MRTPESLTALVTGATDGVGREVATRLAQLGATILVHGRDDARIRATIDVIRSRTGACDLRPLRADLSRLAEGLRGTGVSVHVLHPATFMDTAMIREAEVPPESTVEQGVTALVRLTLDPELDGRTAGFFSGTHPDDRALHPQMTDDHVRAELRRRTARSITATLGAPDVPTQPDGPAGQPDSMTFV